MEIDVLTTQLAAEQGGVLRTDQALELGMTHRTIAHRVQTGRWRRLKRSVYRLLTMRSVEDQLRAAVAALPGAVVSHESAAALHGFPTVARDRVVVTVHTQTTHRFLDVLVHRSHDLLATHVTRLKGLPVTNPARTVVDLAAVLRPRHLEAIVDDLSAAKKIKLDDVRATAELVLRRGKPGAATLRELLEERGNGPDDNPSHLERAGYRLLRDAGLPEPHAEFPIPWTSGRRFDLAYPEAKLAIEWDSRRWHTQVDAFDRDRARDRRALQHGWRTVRFTWEDVHVRPDDVVETLRTLLEH